MFPHFRGPSRRAKGEYFIFTLAPVGGEGGQRPGEEALKGTFRTDSKPPLSRAFTAGPHALEPVCGKFFTFLQCFLLPPIPSISTGDWNHLFAFTALPGIGSPEHALVPGKAGTGSSYFLHAVTRCGRTTLFSGHQWCTDCRHDLPALSELPGHERTGFRELYHGFCPC